MNTKFKSCPEIIARLRTVSEDGVDDYLGDKIVGVQVQQDKHNAAGLVQIDVRSFKRDINLILEIELPELAAEISMDTLNAQRDGEV